MYLIIGIIFILLTITIIYYNRIKSCEMRVQEGYSGIDVALSKRYNVITNLVEVVKGYSKHEKETFELVIKSRNEQLVTRSEYESQLNETVTQLIALSESYPKLQSSEQYLMLQRALADTEEHLQAARRLYNHNVSKLNQTISMFPGSIINGIAKAKPATFYEAQFEERILPTVSFDIIEKR
ncbi:MAG: LemA family protein [Erysipelothrix sp.]